MKKLLERIRKILRDRRTRQFLTRFVSVTAAIVVFVTTYALVLPAITMEEEAQCGIPAHQHDDSCYEERLICGLEESEAHQHDGSCYQKVLTCGKELHIHSTECYKEDSYAVEADLESTAVSANFAVTSETASEITSEVVEENVEHDIPETIDNSQEAADDELYITKDSMDVVNDDEEIEENTEEDTGEGQIIVDRSLDNEKEYQNQQDESIDTENEEKKDDIVEENQGEESEDSEDSEEVSGKENEADDVEVPGNLDDKIDTSETSDTGSESDTANADIIDVETNDIEDDSADKDTDNPVEADTSESAVMEATTDVLEEPVKEEDLSDGYVPALEAVDFDTILTNETGFYYFHTDKEGEVPKESVEIADWKKVDQETELAPADMVRAYFAYTIPAGTLNETNQAARYRLPENLHLTDEQILAINSTENGVALSFERDSEDSEADYQKYLGIEAVEGTRTPDEDIDEYLQKYNGPEYISAIIKAENVYDTENPDGEYGNYLGQDLIFIFSPYTIDKNQITYDKDGIPTAKGEEVKGWFCVDFCLEQIDWEVTDTVDEGTNEYLNENATSDSVTEKTVSYEKDDAEETNDGSDKDTESPDKHSDINENIAADTDNTLAVNDGEQETGAALTHEQLVVKTADIAFVLEDKDRDIKEICEHLVLVEKNDVIDEEKNINTASEVESDNDYDDKESKTDDEKFKTDEEENINDEEENINDDEENIYKEIKESTEGEEEKGKKRTADFPAQIFEETIIVRAGSLSSDIDTKGTEGALPSKTELTVRVSAKKGTFPAGTTMVVTAVTGDALDAVASAVEGTIDARTRGFQAVDISFHDKDGKEIEPAKPIKVNMTSEAIRKAVEDSSTAPVVVHVEDKALSENRGENSTDGDSNSADNKTPTASIIESKHVVSRSENRSNFEKNDDSSKSDSNVKDEAFEKGTSGTTKDTISFDADSFSVYAIVYAVDFHAQVISADGETYEITVNCGEDAQIPYGSELKVREILPEDEEYPGYYNDAVKTASNEAEKNGIEMPVVSGARLFNIEIHGPEGKIEPVAPVQVSIRLAGMSKASHTSVVHFAKDGAESMTLQKTEEQESGGRMSEETESKGQKLEGQVPEEQKETITEINFEADSFSVYTVVSVEDFAAIASGGPYILVSQQGPNPNISSAGGTASVTNYALTASESHYSYNDQYAGTISTLAGKGVVLNKSVSPNTVGGHVTLWYFEPVPQNDGTTRYRIYTEVNSSGETQRRYLTTYYTGLTLVDNAAQADQFRVTVAAGKIRIANMYGSTAYYITNKITNTNSLAPIPVQYSQYGTGTDANADVQFTLATLDPNYEEKTARKVSAEDYRAGTSAGEGNWNEGSTVIIYRRVMNGDGTESIYALATNGSWVEAYDGGDSIYYHCPKGVNVNWQVSYTDQGYIIRSVGDTNTVYLSPSMPNETEGTSGTWCSDSPIGLTMKGIGSSYGSQIEHWDQAAYAYAGLHLQTDNNGNPILTGGVVPGNEGNSDTFLFAVSDNSLLKEGTLHSVDTLDSNSMGITIKMFNYGGPTYNSGYRSAAMQAVLGNDMTDHWDQRKYHVTPMVKNTLGADGFPASLETGQSYGALFKDGTISYPERNETHYFGPMSWTEHIYDGGSINVTGKTANHLFLQSYYDENGMFRYSSLENYAQLNGTATNGIYDFTVYREAGTPYVTAGQSDHYYYYHGHFMPYNTLDSTQDVSRFVDEYGFIEDQNAGRVYENLYGVAGTPDYYFGMTMEATFVQPEDGTLANDEPVVYRFTGDDDLWVYIDDVLVLDISGIHEALSGSINFKTGVVTYPKKYDGTTIQGGTETTTLKEIFMKVRNESTTSDAVKAKIDAIQWKGNTFQDYSTHTFKMFYMERGAGASNLDLEFNLQVVKANEFAVEKKLPEDVDKRFFNQSFKYRATYMDGTVEKPLYAGCKDALGNDICTKVFYKGYKKANGEPDESHLVEVNSNGYFTLKPGEAVLFRMANQTTLYNIKEIRIDEDLVSRVDINGKNVTNTIYTDNNRPNDGRIAAAGNARVEDRGNVVFCNYPYTQNLRITKHITEDSLPTAQGENPVFEFRVYLETTVNENGIDVQKLIPYSNGPYYVVTIPEGQENNEETWTYYKLNGPGNTPVAQPSKVICSETGRSGSINSIPPEYTIIIPNLAIGTHFYVEERRDNIPPGYEFVREELKDGTYDEQTLGATEDVISRILARDEKDHQEFDPATIGKIKERENNHGVDAESHIWNRRPAIDIPVSKQWNPAISAGSASQPSPVTLELVRFKGPEKRTPDEGKGVLFVVHSALYEVNGSNQNEDILPDDFAAVYTLSKNGNIVVSSSDPGFFDLEPGTYVVTATVNHPGTVPSGYQYDSTTSVTVTVTANENTAITLRSSYVKQDSEDTSVVPPANSIPTSITGSIPAGYSLDTSYGESVVLNAAGVWSRTIEDQAVLDDYGNPYYYAYFEREVPEDYTVSYTNNPVNAREMWNQTHPEEGTPNLVTLSAINTKKTGNLELVKAIGAGSNGEGKTFTFKVTLNGADTPRLRLNGSPIPDNQISTVNGVSTITLTFTGEGSVTISDITVGTTYEVEETSMPDGWRQKGDVVITGGDHNNIIADDETEIVTITNEETRRVNATKIWDGGTEPRPTIYFRLFYKVTSGTPEDPIIDEYAVPDQPIKTLASGNTSVYWDGVPVWMNATTQYEYIVKEYVAATENDYDYSEEGHYYYAAAPEDYVKEENGLTITNRRTEDYNPTTSYSGTKIWVDPNDATRPNTLHLTLMIDDGDGNRENDVPATYKNSEGQDVRYPSSWTSQEGNTWRYTFADLPVFDENGNIIQYYVKETPATGYNEQTSTITPARYEQLTNDEPLLRTADYTFHIEGSYDLPYVAIKMADNAYDTDQYDDETHQYVYHIWTARVATPTEKEELLNLLNNSADGFSNPAATMDKNGVTGNTRFVSGLPVTSRPNVELMWRDDILINGVPTGYKVNLHMTGKDIEMDINRWMYFQKVLVGKLRYEYISGSTELKNERDNTQYNARKQWIEEVGTPPKGAEITLNLSATVPGTPTVEDPTPSDVEKDLGDIGISAEDAIIILNGKADYTQDENELVHENGEPENPNTYEDYAWHAHWTNLPKFDKDGKEITYKATETTYKINGKVFNITTSGLIPDYEDESDGTRVVTNGIPDKEIHAKKLWEVPVTHVPDNTKVTLTLSAEVDGQQLSLSTLGVTPESVVLDGVVTTDDENEPETLNTLWSYTWSGMPWYYQGKEIDYTVTETKYEINGVQYPLAAADQTPPENVDFSFTNELPAVSINAVKTWKGTDGTDINNQLDNVSVTFELQWRTESSQWIAVETDEDGQPIANPVTISTTEADPSVWTKSWVNLPKYKNGLPVQYRVVETGARIETNKEEGTALTPADPVIVTFPEIPDEAGTITGAEVDTGTAEITNTLPTTYIAVNKTWGSGSAIWPDQHISVDMTLMQTVGNETVKLPDTIVHYTGETSQTPYAVVTLRGMTDSGWRGLPKYYNDGTRINYVVVESGVFYTPDGEDAEAIPITDIDNFFDVTTDSYEGITENNHETGVYFTIDNKPKQTRISVTKKWQKDGIDRTDKESVSFQLFREGKEDPLVLTEDNTFVDQGDLDLGKIVYIPATDSTPASWQVVTVTGLDKYALKYTPATETEDATVTYELAKYYVQETGDMYNTQVTYFSTIAGGNPVTTDESAMPFDVAVNAGTITIFNREIQITINLLKIDESTRENAEPRVLPDVGFQLMKYNAAMAETSDNPYVNAGDMQISDGNGVLFFSDLGVGKYKIVETVPPLGYIKTENNDIYFMIKNDGTVSWTDKDYQPITTQQNVNYTDETETFTVGNTPGPALPNSGGTGTRLFKLLGTLFIVLAGTGLFLIKRQVKEIIQ